MQQPPPLPSIPKNNSEIPVVPDDAKLSGQAFAALPVWVMFRGKIVTKFVIPFK